MKAFHNRAWKISGSELIFYLQIFTLNSNLLKRWSNLPPLRAKTPSSDAKVLPCFISLEFKGRCVLTITWVHNQTLKFDRSDSTLERNILNTFFFKIVWLFTISGQIIVFFVYFLFLTSPPWARSLDMIGNSVIRSQLTEWVIRLRNQLNWKLLKYQFWKK